MTDYLKPSFSVARSGGPDPATCAHGGAEPWLDPRGRCVLCGDDRREAIMQAMEAVTYAEALERWRARRSA